MSLDVRFYEKHQVLCPHCGLPVKTETVSCEPTCGREWYDILEEIGYYVPPDKRTKKNDWYGKDMELTTEQAEKVYWYVMNHPDHYRSYAVSGLIARAIMNKNTVAVNADW